MAEEAEAFLRQEGQGKEAIDFSEPEPEPEPEPGVPEEAPLSKASSDDLAPLEESDDLLAFEDADTETGPIADPDEDALFDALFNDPEAEDATTGGADKKADAEEEPKKHRSEESEPLRQQAEELGETILKKGSDALEGAKSIADKIFDKANDLVEKAQREAARELEEKVEAAKKLEAEIEAERKKASEPRSGIFDAEDEDLLGRHDDFFERARRFAEGDYQNEGLRTRSPKVNIKKDPSFKQREKEGFVPGFEDLDGDGDEIIDDAIIDDD